MGVSPVFFGDLSKERSYGRGTWNDMKGKEFAKEGAVQPRGEKGSERTLRKDRSGQGGARVSREILARDGYLCQ